MSQYGSPALKAHSLIKEITFDGQNIGLPIRFQWNGSDNTLLIQTITPPNFKDDGLPHGLIITAIDLNKKEHNTLYDNMCYESVIADEWDRENACRKWTLLFRRK